MRKVILLFATAALFAVPASAKSVDEIIAHYLNTVGGMERSRALILCAAAASLMAAADLKLSSSRRTSVGTWCARNSRCKA